MALSQSSPFRYTPFQKSVKKFYRKFAPVPKTTYTPRKIENICAVNFVDPKVLYRFFKRAIRTLRKARGGTSSIGDYLEFGVYNGNSLAAMHQATADLGVGNVRFFGFDAFEGLPPDSEKEDDGVWRPGFYKCTFEQMEGCLQQKGIDPKSINWIKGWYNETLNQATIEKYKLNDPGIVFVDCDTYSSSKAVLDFVTPLIKSPTIICMDDWKLNDLDVKGMGEYQAFNEFVEANPQLTAKEIRSYNRESKSFLVTPA
jgi:O-methyltransferase